jgi:hypothetical protein
MEVVDFQGFESLFSENSENSDKKEYSQFFFLKKNFLVLFRGKKPEKKSKK